MFLRLLSLLVLIVGITNCETSNGNVTNKNESSTLPEGVIASFKKPQINPFNQEISFYYYESDSYMQVVLLNPISKAGQGVFSMDVEASEIDVSWIDKDTLMIMYPFDVAYSQKETCASFLDDSLIIKYVAYGNAENPYDSCYCNTTLMQFENYHSAKNISKFIESFLRSYSKTCTLVVKQRFAECFNKLLLENNRLVIHQLDMDDCIQKNEIIATLNLIKVIEHDSLIGLLSEPLIMVNPNRQGFLNDLIKVIENQKVSSPPRNHLNPLVKL